MLQSLLFLNALCFGVGMPLVCQENIQEIQEKVEFKQDNKKFVSYNDEACVITLSAYELNNYIYEHLSYALNDLFQITDSLSVIMDEVIYDGYSYSIDDFESVSDHLGFVFTYSDYFISFSNTTYIFEFYEDGDVPVYSDFTTTLDFNISSTYYADIKQAIELDIQANTQPHLQPVLTELVSLLTAGITALASGIGQGVSTLVSDIFINNGALSTFGAIICIFGGIAFAIGLSRWVMYFLTSLGAKK